MTEEGRQVEAILVEVSKLELKPGDALLVRFHGDVPMEYVSSLAKKVGDYLKVKIIAIRDDIEFTVMEFEE